jgi:hypothetical protein
MNLSSCADMSLPRPLRLWFSEEQAMRRVSTELGHIHLVVAHYRRLQGVSGSKKLRNRNSRLAFGQFLGGLSETHFDEGFK